MFTRFLWEISMHRNAWNVRNVRKPVYKYAEYSKFIEICVYKNMKLQKHPRSIYG